MLISTLIRKITLIITSIFIIGIFQTTFAFNFNFSKENISNKISNIFSFEKAIEIAFKNINIDKINEIENKLISNFNNEHYKYTKEISNIINIESTKISKIIYLDSKNIPIIIEKNLKVKLTTNQKQQLIALENSEIRKTEELKKEMITMIFKI